MSNDTRTTTDSTNTRTGLLLLALLALTIFLLFARSFKPGFVLFSSDGPLGITSSRCISSLDTLVGAWWDVFWLGTNAGTASPSLNFIVFFVLGPLYFAKFHAVVASLLLGLSAYFFFRQLRFSPMIAGLGAIAAGLNMNYFSNVCWGLPTRAFTLAFIFAALGLLAGPTRPWRWVRIVLAGLAVGMSVMEGADNGAIFSLYVAAFAMFLALIREGAPSSRLARGAATVGVVAICAGVIATQALISLIGTSIKGVAYLEQQKESAEQRWNIATQWSLPKKEILRVIVPGLFGYRTEPDPKGSEYWGEVGRQPGWEQHKQGSPRHSGSGEYAGVLVVLVALWAAAQSFRRNGAYSEFERKIIWFWCVAAVISVLFAFGRHAPFYQLLYGLPYFSTIRNPIKFMHPFHLAMLILFGYGMQGLARLYLDRAASQARSLSEQLKSWWAKANGFEKKWTLGSLAALGLGVIVMLVYSSARGSLLDYLSNNGFDSEAASAIARFSGHELGLFVLFLALSVGLVTLIMCGVFAGRRASWAAVLLGLLLVVDLARANKPWIKYFNYVERYATNEVFQTLANKAYEHRVTVVGPQLQNIYRAEWLQHQFPYYNIQALDMAQDPRMAADKEAYLKTVGNNILRYWQLTNARYILGMAGGFLEKLNQELDPAKRRFRQVQAFTIVPSPSGEYAQLQTNPNGPLAVIEFAGALPRARLYSRWQVNTNDQATLKQLAGESFDPEQLVIVADPIPASPSGDAGGEPGAVDYVSYAPKAIKLQAKAAGPSVLLLNDKHDAAWKVWVDGKPDKLLRANFIVRGVYLQPGEHTVEFRFQPSLTGFYITLATMAIGVLLCGFLIVSNRRTAAPESQPAQPRQPETAKPKAATRSK